MIAAPSRLAVALVALLPLLSCSDEPDEAATTHTSETTTAWHTLGTWSGHGERQTESFDITSGALRVSWEASSGEPSTSDVEPGGTLRVELHSAISGRPLETVVDVVGDGTGTVRVTASPRTAYLLIESDRVDWTVTLDEGVSVPGS